MKIAFSDDADSTTINTANVYLTQNGVKQLATVTYDATNKEATLTLTGSFLQGKEYILTVDGVKSVDGAEFAKYTTSFVTAQEVSVIAGKFYHNNQALGTSVSVATEYNGCDSSIDGGSINDTNEAIFVKFANAMDDNTLNTTNIKIYDKTDDRYLTLNCTLTTENGTTGTKNVVKIQPNNDAFVSKHEYVLTLNNAILDVAGNKLLPYTATFFCNGDAPDYKAGTVSPENAQVGVYPKLVPGDGNRAFAWSVQIDKEELDPSTVNTTNIYMTNKDTDTTVPTKVEYSAASGFLTITPLSDLDENVTYTVTIKDVKGKNGLRLPDKKDGTAYSFTTGDFTKPTVVSVTPANAAEGVKITDSIVINFSEKVNSTDLSLGTNIRLLDASNSNATFANFGSWTKEISADGKTLTITPAEGKELLPNRTYKLVIEKGVINDAAGNTVDEKTEIVFTTANTATTVAKSLKADAFGDTGVEVKDGDTDVKQGVQYFYINYSSALKGNVANTYQLENLVKVERYVAENGKWVPVTVAATPGLNTVGVALDNAGKSIKITAPSDYTDDPNTAIIEGDWYNSSNVLQTVTAYDNKFVDDTQYRITLPSTIKDSNDNAVEAATYTFTIGSKPVVDTAKSYPEAFNGGTPYKAPYLAVVLSDTESKLQDTTLNKDTVKIVKKSDGTVADQYALAYTNVEQDKTTGTVINNPRAGVVTSIQVAGASQNSQTINVDGVNDIRTVLKVGDTIQYGSGSTTTITALSANSITTADTMTPSDDDYVTITACAGNTIAVDGNSALSTLKVGDIVDFGANNVAVVTSVDSATRITLDRAVAALDHTNIKVKTGVVYKLKTDEALDQNTEYQVVVSGVKDIAGNPVSDTKYTFKTNAEVAKLAVTSCTVADGDTNVATGKKIEIKFNEALTNVDNNEEFVASISDTNDKRVLFKKHSGAVVHGRYELSSDKKTITFLPDGYLDANTVYDVEIDQTAASSAGAMKDDYKFSFKTEENSSAAITSAVYYDSDGDGKVSDNDVIRVTFNTTSLKNTALVVGYFDVNGAGSNLGSSTMDPADVASYTKNYVDIKLQGATITPGLTKIKVKMDTGLAAGNDAQNNGATFGTDEVTITVAK